ncbi:MAG: type II secretion system F family protein, partial [Calditrichaeota bacterium]
MADFKFEGVTYNGRNVQGIVQADNRSEAKRKIQQLAAQHNVEIKKILKRRTFIYKVQREDEKPIKGELKAFSKEEVQEALQKLGYNVLRIEPKLLDFQLKPPTAEIVTFVQVCTNLLREKMPFNEALQLLVYDIQNAALRDAIKEINNDLRQGKDSEEAFMKQEKVLGKFTARMLGLASKSGNMSVIYENTAKFLERQMEFKRNLKSALIMPIFTMAILVLAIIFYILYIFPETANLFVKLGTELPPMTAATLKLSNYLNENLWWIGTICGVLLLGLAYFLHTPRGKFFIDKYILKLPVLGSLIHRTTIEIFCRVFHALYSGSGENIDAIRLAAEACGNRYIEHQIKNVA